MAPSSSSIISPPTAGIGKEFCGITRDRNHQPSASAFCIPQNPNSCARAPSCPAEVRWRIQKQDCFFDAVRHFDDCSAAQLGGPRPCSCAGGCVGCLSLFGVSSIVFIHDFSLRFAMGFSLSLDIGISLVIGPWTLVIHPRTFVIPLRACLLAPASSSLGVPRSATI